MIKMTKKEKIKLILENLYDIAYATAENQEQYLSEKDAVEKATNEILKITTKPELNEKEVYEIVHDWWENGLDEQSFISKLAKKICSCFSKPELKLPEKKELYMDESCEYCGKHKWECECGKREIYNKAIEDTKTLNGLK